MSCSILALMATLWGAGQQIAQSAASDGAAASAAVNEEEVRGPHASLAVRLQVRCCPQPHTHVLCLVPSCQDNTRGYRRGLPLLHDHHIQWMAHGIAVHVAMYLVYVIKLCMAAYQILLPRVRACAQAD